MTSLLSDEDVATLRSKWLREVLVSMQAFERKGRPALLYETVDLLVRMGALPGGDSFQMMNHVSGLAAELLGHPPEADDFKGAALSDLLGMLSA